VGSCRRDLLDHIVALNERHLKRLLSEYVRYHHGDRTHLGLEKRTPDGRIRSVVPVGSFHRSDSAGCTIVTIERPSPDRLSADPLYICIYMRIYMRSTCTRVRALQSLSCRIEAIIVFRTALPKTAASLSRLKFWRTAVVDITNVWVIERGCSTSLALEPLQRL
jgi:hypothetical protein